MRVAGASLLAFGVAATALVLTGCQSLAPAQEVLHATTRLVGSADDAATPIRPYVDVTRPLPSDARTTMAATGAARFTVGPITGGSGICMAMWGNSASDHLDARRAVHGILDAGGAVELSLGGPAGAAAGHLEQNCPSARELTLALERLIADFSAPGRPASLDLVFTDDRGSDPASEQLMARALIRLRDRNTERPEGPPRLAVTVTADPTAGLTRPARAILAKFISAGVHIDTITVSVSPPAGTVARDRPPASAGMAGAVVAAATAAHSDVLDLFATHGDKITARQAWAMINLRFSIGENPATSAVAHPVLTPDDAEDVATFAAQLAAEGTPLQALSIWSLNRDRSCPNQPSAVDGTTGARWAPPQSTCNLAGGNLEYTRLLAQ